MVANTRSGNKCKRYSLGRHDGMCPLSGTPTNFGEPSYVDKLFSYLYQRLVRYTDKKIRTGVRLDHWAYGDSPESDAHPLLNRLAAVEESQPLQILLALSY